MYKSVLSLAYLLIPLFSMFGCAFDDQKPVGLPVTEFFAELSKSCQEVNLIYEGHGSSGFTNKDGSGPFTREGVTLRGMTKTLRKCGANPDEVRMIIE